MSALDVLVRLARVQQGGGAAAAAEQFQSTASGLQSDPVSVQSALQLVAAVPPQQWAASAAALSPAQRENMHRQILLFAQSLVDDVREMGQGVSALRLVMLRVLPALQGLPEDRQFGTSAVLADQYQVFNTVADLMRPEANAALASAKVKASELASQVGNLAGRMKKAGLNPTAPECDGAQRTTIIALGIVAGLLLVGLCIAVYFAAKHNKRLARSEVAKLGGRSGGGGHGGRVAGGGSALAGAPQSAAAAASGFMSAPAAAMIGGGVSGSGNPYIKFPAMPRWGGGVD